MNPVPHTKIWLSMTGVFFALSLSSCVVDPYHPHAPGPPPVFYPYDYYFYPSVGIYYHYSTGYYYYRSSGSWIRTQVLPPNILLHPHGRVYLRLDSDKPYLKYKQHQEQYRPKRQYQPASPIDRYEREQNRQTHQKYQQQQKQYKKDRGKRGGPGY